MQSLLFLGASWFIIVRVHFMRKSLSWKKIVLYSMVSFYIGSLGVYKANYANEIIQYNKHYNKWSNHDKKI